MLALTEFSTIIIVKKRLKPFTEKTTMKERLLKQIKVEQNKSEILINICHIIFIIAVFLLWFLSPKAHRGEVDFEPVPLLLAIYLPLIILRLSLAKKKILATPLLYVFSIIEAIFLGTLIWSFHIQYMQVPATYLKAPTIIYFFIFLALRALRYEVKLLLFTGSMFVITWSLLTMYALLDPRTIRTHRYVDYTATEAMLLGAEIEKILGIFFITIFLAIGVYRSRKLLFRAVKEANLARDLSRFFNPDTVSKFISSNKIIRPGTGECYQAAILMMDIRGFTKLSEVQPPDETMQLLTEYQKRMVSVIFKNNGAIDKYMGDGILAHFGITHPTSNFASDALKTAKELDIAMKAWNREREDLGLKKLGFGISIATGDVIFGAVGEKNRLELTITGKAVNLAAKLEKATKDLNLRAICTTETVQIAKKQGFNNLSDLEILKDKKIEGLKSPVDLVALVK